MKDSWKVNFEPEIVLDKTMELVVVPMQEQIGSLFLTECLHIIDAEHIIRTGRYRESIMPTSLPTKESPDITIASVGCPYAIHLEYGTSRMVAKGVFRRAIASVKSHLGR